ncbi:MAG: TetR family transcriptional regulator [Lactobacillus sp.]|nr:MAG: TetR family transcriptional regulator [Lactobacillus sp.]
MGNDPRFKHTEEILRKAFIQLMSTGGYSKITVTRLINTAKINRTTFYAHYLDKADLLQELETKLLDGLLQISRTLPGKIFLHNDPETNLSELVKQTSPIFTYLQANGQLLSLLLDPVKGDLAFANELTTTIRQSWDNNHIIKHLNVPESYALAVVSGIIGSMIDEWVQRNFRESSDDFAAITLKIIKSLSYEMVN